MIYTVRTSTDINTVKAELAAKAKEVNFNLLSTYDFKHFFRNKGYPIKKDITVFELCNPAGAQQVLEYLSEISIYLPCRTSVYENNGITYLSTIGMQDIVQTFEVDEDLQSHMTILFENLKQIMHSWDKES
jgi:uncharacterized protein (DUF302 family)